MALSIRFEQDLTSHAPESTSDLSHACITSNTPKSMSKEKARLAQAAAVSTLGQLFPKQNCVLHMLCSLSTSRRDTSISDAQQNLSRLELTPKPRLEPRLFCLRLQHLQRHRQRIAQVQSGRRFHARPDRVGGALAA